MGPFCGVRFDPGPWLLRGCYARVVTWHTSWRFFFLGYFLHCSVCHLFYRIAVNWLAVFELKKGFTFFYV
jgi:hypothetical protein